MATTKYEWTEEGVREFNRIRRKVDGIKGRGVDNKPQYITISDPAPKSPRLSGGGSSLPVPQYAGMFYGGVAANQGGFMFIEALGDLPT